MQPATVGELADRLTGCGARSVQVALDPIRLGVMAPDALVAELRQRDVEIASGMMAMKDEDYSSLDSIRRSGGIRPDSTWPDNEAAAVANADLARTLGIRLVTFHAGFVPHDPADPDRAPLIGRLARLAEIFGDAGIAVGLETGQESAETLLRLLADLATPNVGVNFDPANMILYGMGDPVQAVERLGSEIRQVHLKDALPSQRLGEWGTEVPVGRGAVDWAAFFAALSTAAPQVDLMIEREAGDQRVEDIRIARDFVVAIGAARP